MIVQCPYCATRYKLDEARLTGPNPMLKCSRCRHVFPAPSSKKPAAARPAVVRASAPPAQENLTLPFEDTEWKAEAEESPGLFELPELEDTFTLGAKEQVEDSVAASAAEPPPVRQPAAAPVRAPAAPRAAARRRTEVADNGRTAHDNPPRHRERGKVRAILVFLAIVVGGYAVMTRALFASPALCDRLLDRLPLIGTLGDERLLIRKVALSDVVGNYQRIKDGKEVFVIAGKALNTAPMALRLVQISGKLYDKNDQAVDQKTIYCGNVISAKVLKDLTPNELSILQKLNPPPSFMIEPGESSTFVIVFMDPPRNVVEFSTSVVAAQRQV
jgi:predicted Zn finger-like uncharacterized protein